ncbi:hypothetical protein PPL_08249 [Heterostelium album PN500]|uniref:Uncharacterized protein n=1 Tax=Heterostelium pallidum (strain ATCC 26659 / Pp 5 / PN500) TaxID=670386 RepID=D3BJ12_HETP5|nr:hypothetical protein PPL_08249 [Heterostelium album PN500]EFA78786.1 hypothetical protein PPL_08249 [Heterostelium album PN500]|eukprot:XP_020430910.1 hypothetical protein PPL_08249 [Heterostelium album PN500]
MSTRIDASNRALRHQHTLLLQNAKKQQLKGPVTKWEKKWVTVGHLKLLKWIALKPKKPVVGNQAVARTKDNVPNKAAEVSNTIRTRSKRGSTTEGGASLVETEMEMIYLNSLPKTRSNSRRLEKIQKKLQENAATKDDGTDESSSTTTTTTTTTSTDDSSGRPNSLKKKIFINKGAGLGAGNAVQSVPSPSSLASSGIGSIESQKDQSSTPRGQISNVNNQHDDDDDDDDEEEDLSKMEDDDDDDDDKMMGAHHHHSNRAADEEDDDDSDDDQDLQRGGKATDSQMDDDDDEEEGAY